MPTSWTRIVDGWRPVESSKTGPGREQLRGKSLPVCPQGCYRRPRWVEREQPEVAAAQRGGGGPGSGSAISPDGGACAEC